MAKIRSVGFDMDHTLAIYNRESFETLAFGETLKKFIDAGYPEELIRLNFKPNFLIRGLLVDRERGNILKVDAHKYVKSAYHGHTPLTKSERHKLYNNQSFKADKFLSVDTFFALSEVQLFVEIVDFMAKYPGRIEKSFVEVYDDLRQFIDLSHRDGSIKDKVLSSPEKYIQRDKYLGNALIRLLDAGKSLFLLTNSMWDYTDVIMSYVLGATSSEDLSNWRDYFNYIIVGGGKPGFFTGSQPFLEVVPVSGLLKIHHGALSSSAVYHGGNATLFQKLTKVQGDEILYVGDHIYGDIMQSKGLFNWRTMLIVEELEDEIPKLAAQHKQLETIMDLVAKREVLDEELQKMRSLIAANIEQRDRANQNSEAKKAHYLSKENEKSIEQAENATGKLQQADKEIREKILERERAIHPIWGELMKVRLERSRFANQVSSYACIYTSKASNLRYYSPFKRHESFYERMPHD
jgi:HAD superfamily 5'-nucleotidase-like hydrolase